MKLNSISAVVTGGASGIGRAVAEALVARNCSVVIADIDREGAEETAAQFGPDAYAIACDVRDVDAIEAMADEAWALLGGVDFAFANAGVGPGAPLLQATAQEFDFIYDINVRGSWATCKAFANRMIANERSGHIAVCGSEHSLGMQHTMMGHYTASKHAVLGWADVLRNELPDTIKMSVLCPGVVKTMLYDGRRNSELPPLDDAALTMGKKVMDLGMNPDECAQTFMRGIEADAFLVPTHASARSAAQRRWEEIDAAFADYAPAGSETEKYEMNQILAQAMSEIAGGEQ